MAGVSVSRLIPVPVTEVWRVFADPRVRGGCPEVAEVEPLTPCTPGVLVPGQRWRETRTTAAGGAVTEELVVLAVEPERSCTVGLAGATGAALSYRFDPVPAGTVVTAGTYRDHWANRPRALGTLLTQAIVGGFAARTAEG